MPTSTEFVSIVVVILGLGAILRWTWIDAERFPVIGANRWTREFASYGVAGFAVSAAVLIVTLIRNDPRISYLPAIVSAELALTSLFCMYIAKIVVSGDRSLDARVQKAWSVLLGTIILCYAVAIVPKSAGVPELIQNGCGAFAALSSIGLCWYSMRFRSVLSRPAVFAGFLPLAIPLILAIMFKR